MTNQIETIMALVHNMASDKEIRQALEAALKQGEPVAVFDERLGRPVLVEGAPLLAQGQPLYTAPPALKQGEVVAMRGDYDGHGYRYIDSGSGSDWRERHPDWEPMYDGPQADNVAACERGVFDKNRSALEAALKPGKPVRRVYLTATGETHDGQETYTRHEDAPPPLCESECLYTAPPAQTPVPPRLTDDQLVEIFRSVHPRNRLDFNKSYVRDVETAVRKQFGVNDE